MNYALKKILFITRKNQIVACSSLRPDPPAKDADENAQDDAAEGFGGGVTENLAQFLKFL